MLTFLNICNCTRATQKFSTNLFLFSLQVLSIWRYKISGKWLVFWAKSLRTCTITVKVKLLSCGYCNKSTKQWNCFTKDAFLCKIAPVTWVHKHHRDDVDLVISLVFGRFVFDWSMPSMIMVRYLSDVNEISLHVNDIIVFNSAREAIHTSLTC